MHRERDSGIVGGSRISLPYQNYGLGKAVVKKSLGSVVETWCEAGRTSGNTLGEEPGQSSGCRVFF